MRAGKVQTKAETMATYRARKRFLEKLEVAGNVSEAARETPFSRETFYKWKHKNKNFCAKWDRAVEIAIDRMEREAYRRAVEGIPTPVIYQGQITGTYLTYSDRLMELLLKAHRPEKYKDRSSTELSGPGGEPLTVHHNVIQDKGETKALKDMARAYLMNQYAQPTERDPEPERKAIAYDAPACDDNIIDVTPIEDNEDDFEFWEP